MRTVYNPRVRAIAKVQPAPGLDLIDAPEPAPKPGQVLLRVEKGSICGTDLHIFQWDGWAASRIRPPRIVGHEFCGTVVALGEGVTDRRVGDFVASESHIVCGQCLQCRSGQAHVCANTSILGVDVDGGFRPLAAVPAANARPTPDSVPRTWASMQDAIGNAVHTVCAGPVEGRSVLITGLGPIGLFAVGICRALGARRVVGTEISPYRIGLAESMGIDAVVNPATEDASAELKRLEPGGFDAALEMSGHPSSFGLVVEHTRPGGRVSLLGVFPSALDFVDLNTVVFKGLDVQGIVGRRLWDTWERMQELLGGGGFDPGPVITHELPACHYLDAMSLLASGQAGKIVLDFGGF